MNQVATTLGAAVMLMAAAEAGRHPLWAVSTCGTAGWKCGKGLVCKDSVCSKPCGGLREKKCGALFSDGASSSMLVEGIQDIIHTYCPNDPICLNAVLVEVAHVSS